MKLKSQTPNSDSFNVNIYIASSRSVEVYVLIFLFGPLLIWKLKENLLPWRFNGQSQESIFYIHHQAKKHIFMIYDDA